MSTPETWDVFCRVVDNYGDVGIAWRLARQLAAGARGVRLFVDDLGSFARIEPRVDARIGVRDVAQRVDGVEIRCAPSGDVASATASVVVEVLGCGIPDRYLDAMVRARTTPVWIDFEHLSAERWVDGFHGLPSPHPTLPLTKHFFYPGFGDATGGLLIEPAIDERRRAFVDDTAAVAAFRERLGLETAAKHATLFAYPGAPAAGLLDAFARDRSRWSLAVPDGVLTDAIDAWFGERGAVGTTRRRGSLAVTIVPFVDQDDFDRLLWASDANFVRGEDSFVRAQIAGRPFVWHLYPQVDEAHLQKLIAFEALYAAQAGSPGGLWRAWNDPDADVAAMASDWLGDLSRSAEAARRWRSIVMASEPLIGRLVAFAAERRTVP